MMPGMDGFGVLRRLRADGIDSPALFLTARDTLQDKIAGLTLGGDDYVTKPFSLEEVLARLRGLLRRAGMTRDRDDAALLVVGFVSLLITWAAVRLSRLGTYQISGAFFGASAAVAGATLLATGALVLALQGTSLDAP